MKVICPNCRCDNDIAEWVVLDGSLSLNCRGCSAHLELAVTLEQDVHERIPFDGSVDVDYYDFENSLM